MTDLIIIGAGTAGLTAAIYGARAGLSVTVIEKSIYGGQVITTSSIENYPAIAHINGADFAHALFGQVKSLGVAVLYETVEKLTLTSATKEVHTNKNLHQARSIILATGTTPKKLGVAGEEKWLGRGLAFCATCDGALYKGKDVAVVGGGNTAIEDALFLSSICHSVTLIHRRGHFRAESVQLEQVKKRDNIRILTDTVVKEVVGDKAVSSLLLENEKSFSLDVAGVFVAIGSSPNSHFFPKELTLDSFGYVSAGEDCHTNLPAVFVAGDIRTKTVRQLVTAAADGAVSALAANEYVQTLGL